MWKDANTTQIQFYNKQGKDSTICHDKRTQIKQEENEKTKFLPRQTVKTKITIFKSPHPEKIESGGEDETK